MSRVQGGWASRRKIPSQFVTPVRPRMKPNDIIIKSDGEHILSRGPNGTSKIFYINDFLPQVDADRYLSHLLAELPWGQAKDDFGVHNRLTAWYGEHPYTYVGLTHSASKEWHPILQEIMRKIEDKLSYVDSMRHPPLNSVLCNLYRDNRDGVGWHSDSETGLGKRPFIASVSLGQTRIFEMRQKPTEAPLDDYSYSQYVKFHLTHGSLLIMLDSTQDDWQHRVPTEYHDKMPRINLTFRTIYPVG